MTFRFRRCLTLLWLTGLGPLRAQPALPRPEQLTYRQGLPQAFVPAIVQDRQGFIWMATRDGLCRYDGRTFKVFQPDPSGRPSLSATGVLDLKMDSQGRLWVSSGDMFLGALDVFDPRTETFFNYSRQPFFQKLMRQEGFKQHYVDRRNTLWLLHLKRGLTAIDLGTHRVRQFRHRPNDPTTLSSDSVTALREDAQGMLWVATPRGLDRVSPQTGRIQRFHARPGDPEALPENFISNVLPLPTGELLVISPRFVTLFAPGVATPGVATPGRHPTRIYRLPTTTTVVNRKVEVVTDSRGVVYFNQYGSLYRFTPRDGPRLMAVAEQENLHFVSLCIDRSDVLWTGTTGAGVFKYDLRAAPFRAWPYRENFMADLLKRGLGAPAAEVPAALNRATSYQFRSALDAQDGLWFSAAGWPVYRLDQRTNRIQTLPKPPSAQGTRPGLVPLLPLATDPRGTVWVVQDTAVFFYPPNERVAQRLTHPLRLPVWCNILQVVADETDLWLATETAGLFRFDRRTGSLRQYAHQPGNPASLSSNDLFCLFTDPDDPDRLWVGTFGSGLCRFDKRTGLCRRFTVENGLPNNVIYAAIPDRYGYLWVATNRGLCRLNRRTFETQTYTSDDGLLADEFNRFHFLYLPGGRATADRLFLGGLEGITSLEIGAFSPDAFRPRVELTTLTVNNRPFLPTPDSLPPQALTRLDLPHDQNFVTLGFAALQFNQRGKTAYRYRLDGVDKEWVRTTRPEAVYTNLAPGTYTLRLNAANTSGVWSPYVRTLVVRVRPPWWATWWAYLLYAVGAAGVAFGLVRGYLNRLHWRQAVRLRQREAEQLRLLDEMKSQFFANLTHEFRTPLTLILNSAEQLEKSPDPARRPERFAAIRRNAHQLLRLITQLLDTAKLDAGKLAIKRSLGDPDAFLERVVDSFGPLAERKNIRLTYRGEVDSIVFFDEEKLETIACNLLSNALKFTPEGGEVVVGGWLFAKNPTTNRAADRNQPPTTNNEPRTARRTASTLVLQVSDTGPGILPDKLPRIFERFFQADASSTRAHEGTGIGLSFVKELTELLGGSVRVQSTVGRGSTFTVTIPVEVAGEVGPEAPKPPKEALFFGDENAPSGGLGTSETAPLVLVVEDNDELRRYLVEVLAPTYRVLEAPDGQAGLDAALDAVPDLILSDVMMPRLDGYALLGALKADLRTSHIPVVLLTAKSSYDSRLRGLGLGADAHLSKPFSPDELTLCLRNLLQTRRAWQTHLGGLETEKSTPEPVPEKEALFLERLRQLLLRHLQDEVVDADWLAQQAHMSRTQLHRKLTALTNRSTTAFIHRVRLERAAELLQQGQMNVAEVAYAVGYGSQSYFTKQFREHFGRVPTAVKA
jgi:signal transduction histidine kinase/ligand-binding sensor domain-containing protein/CheY-like chemotaxis protein